MHPSFPRLLLNETICKRNISKMAEKCSAHHVVFRPHFKTHQSLDVAEWFRGTGVTSITVSSLKMALYFASGGWKDIFIAFPVNLLDIAALNRLAETIQLAVSVESEYTARELAEKMSHRVSVYIKIDTGDHRTGLDPDDKEEIGRILDVTGKAKNLKCEGFYTHSGQTYHATDKKEIAHIHAHSTRQLNELRHRYSMDYPGLILSVGDTPSCSIVSDFKLVDELRPGNFVFYDVMQSLLGSCTTADVAVALECPVVAKHSRRNELVIHGGAVHLSKESVEYRGNRIFGLVVALGREGWESPLANTFVAGLSQEHGIIRTDTSHFNSIRIGDTLGILPVHSCLTANLAENYLTLTGQTLRKMRS